MSVSSVAAKEEMHSSDAISSDSARKNKFRTFLSTEKDLLAQKLEVFL